MSQPNRIAFIGNSLPRRCGIATFTTDLQQAIGSAVPGVETTIVAMTDHGSAYDYPESVGMSVDDRNLEEYERAAEFLNRGRFEVVSLQHEFGIFGGDAGGHILAMLSRLDVPLVTTLHTVLAQPTAVQHAVLDGVVDASASVIVMVEKARELLLDVYRVPASKIAVVPHGIPDSAFVQPDAAKAAFGFSGRAVLLTFGLLSPNKGIDVVIDAMPSILASRDDAVYVVLGATHPNLARDQGEAYRASLMERARALGVDDHVVFLDRFVDQATLLQYISMCDVYVTPYLNEAQMTSGTLAYSFGLGKAVVSTPYWHARELLADGRGILVPFGDAAETGRAIAGLLSDDARRAALGERAYSESRSMTWERTAERYRTIFEAARADHGLRAMPRPALVGPAGYLHVVPEMRFGHLLSMCDDTGLLQHSVHSVPDRTHGYCIDDNARALLLACTLDADDEVCLPDALTARLAAFVQHAWNRGARRFRNFMSFDRRWLEETGSEDSHGRTLWALGECARSDGDASRRRWAAALFAEALLQAETFGYPRASAFTLLGLGAYCAAIPSDSGARRAQHRLAAKLTALLATFETTDWVWFEDVLAYDNARLPQALIVTGLSTGTPAYTTAGLRSLRWLVSQQTTPEGLFRPVGTQSFGMRRRAPRPFDQQPIEAAATIAACLAAWQADGDPDWRSEATRAFQWFLGGNDLALPVVDLETGSCRDGLHPDRANENRGAESVLSYLLGLADIRRAVRLHRTTPLTRLSEAHFVPGPIPEPDRRMSLAARS